MKENLFQDMFQSAVTRTDQIILSEVSKLQDFEDPALVEALKSMYENEILNLRLMAVVINSTVTQSKITFLFSKRILENLLKKCKSIKRSTISGQEYKAFMTWSRNNKWLTLLASGKGIGSASVVEMTYSPVIQIILKKVTQDFITAQRDNCLKLHTTSQETSHQTSHDIMINNNTIKQDVSIIQNKEPNKGSLVANSPATTSNPEKNKKVPPRKLNPVLEMQRTLSETVKVLDYDDRNNPEVILKLITSNPEYKRLRLDNVSIALQDAYVDMKVIKNILAFFETQKVS